MHPVLAVGVDDQRRRLIVVSADSNGRAAAMVQADIQAAVDSVRVLVCRPAIVALTRQGYEHDPKQIRQAILGGAGAFMQHWTEALNAAPPDTPMSDDSIDAVREAVTRVDLRMGLCPVVLDDFSLDEIEGICSGRNPDDTRGILQRLHLLQYFFPSPDQLALGLIERGAPTPSGLLSNLEAAPHLGHPYASPELMSPASLPDVVEALQERGLVVEGEMSLEVTPAGNTIRSSVRFKPREGLVSKLLNRVSVTLSLKDFLGRP